MRNGGDAGEQAPGDSGRDVAGEPASAFSRGVNELLDAVISLGSDLHLSRVLDRIVESACQLVGAQYGALAVVDADDHITTFVTFGIDDALRQEIGAIPQGSGLLGQLLRHPAPLRLDQLPHQPDAAGFPPGHPPMDTLLGVPVRVRGTVFGHLLLSEKKDGSPFSPADEEVVRALVAAAGFVIENARAYAVSERQRRWLEAASQMAESITSQTPAAEAFDEIVRNARAVAGARAVAIVAATEGDVPTLLATDGPEADRTAALVDEQSGAVRQALGGRERDLRLADDRTLMLVPLLAQLNRASALVVLLDVSSPGVSPDLELIRSFADQAALTLDQAQGVRDRASMAVVSDRERIARDLHDSVIQRLFACGLMVQSALTAPAGSQVDTLDVLIRVGSNLDQTISDIRTTIFELQSSGSTSLRGQVLALTQELADPLGFSPSVRSHGAVDTVVGGGMADEVLAVLREALSNVARHAGASAAWVDLKVSSEALLLVVGDDGVGLPADRSEGGLANMLARAERHGGTCDVASPATGGTVVRWRVPFEDWAPAPGHAPGGLS